MISKELLQNAADKGIIQTHQIQPLLHFCETRQASPGNSVHEEPLKFIRSFGDVFITLGVVLLVVAINMIELSGYAYLLPVAGFVVVAEWLVRVRRLALPGIAILIAILFFVNQAIAFDHENASVYGLGILTVVSLSFYLRYKMPFSLLPLAAGLVAIAVIQIGVDILGQPFIFAGLGLIVFIVAMLFDIRDTGRQSHLSDSAFWLHLLASPLIVHGAMTSLLFSGASWLQAVDREVIIILFFLVFLLLALLLDRRAMLVSTQLYMIYALTQIFEGQLDSTQNVMIFVLMAVGLLVIFFGSYWYKTRRLIFGFLSGSAICRYVPSLDVLDSSSM
ncbi:MAG: hypothetical protein GY820_19395 [Gammaproteobacteria bacterium]|nr:hypothetical protein [Gammaproteobacteria bacterium]